MLCSTVQELLGDKVVADVPSIIPLDARVLTPSFAQADNASLSLNLLRSAAVGARLTLVSFAIGKGVAGSRSNFFADSFSVKFTTSSTK